MPQEFTKGQRVRMYKLGRLASYAPGSATKRAIVLDVLTEQYWYGTVAKVEQTYYIVDWDNGFGVGVVDKAKRYLGARTWNLEACDE